MLLSNPRLDCLSNVSCLPGLGPAKLKRSKATCPSRPACHRRGLNGAGELLTHPPLHPHNDYLTPPGTAQALLWFQIRSYL